MKKQLLKTYFPHLFLFSFLTFSGGNLRAQHTFTIVSPEAEVTICIDKNESSVVKKAANMFSHDIFEITGKKLSIQNSLHLKGTSIVAGTLGQSKLLTQIIQKHHLKVDSVMGRWEAFSIQIVERKAGNLLVVMGNDRRGTAYGILELSRMTGISPWIWWADVKPKKMKEVSIVLAKPVFQHPSVQYRGIFLNDEDWGLKPWASKTIEPETGEIGPKTYSKIFELLLRLRANTIWPAMHECTTPFYFVNGNAAMADSFGIIVSTSHCEPLMRSNPREWDHKKDGDYNFFTNKKSVTNYWEKRLTEVSEYENIYTVGMRGIHDGAMEGAKTIPKQVEGLTDVFNVQREMLGKSLNKNPEEIPQIFIPYKEVLDAYEAGLKVPDDVTLVWCDDNYGYMKRLSNEAERKRKGGSGVYYHISYWGRPHDYLWLATTQPSFIWQEIQKSWAYGARKIWILNVGDIKPAEYLTEFYLDMAWDINAIKPDQISNHLENWMGKTFGTENAAPLKNIMNEYYRLAFIRRPEFMGWSQTEPTTKVNPTGLNFSEFGDEVATRLRQYDRIEKQADSVSLHIPSSMKNAYFELVKYPVSGAAEMNRKWMNSRYATIFGQFHLNESMPAAQKSKDAWDKIQQMTTYYNDSIENGKWKFMMSAQPRKLPVFDKPIFAEPDSTLQQGSIFWAEESDKPMTKGDTVSLVLDNCTKGIYCFNSDSFTLSNKPEWLSVERFSTNQDANLPAGKLILKLIQQKMKGSEVNGLLTLSSKNNSYFIAIQGISDTVSSQKDRCIRLNASAFTRNNKKDSAGWQAVERLGYSRSAMLLQPYNSKLNPDLLQNPSLEYEFSIEKADSALIQLYLLPTHPPESDKALRIAVSMDGSLPKLFNIKTEGRSAAWKENVLRNRAIIKMPWKFSATGKHRLRIFAVDPDLIIDQLQIDFKINRTFYGVGE